jgi:putative transcriptional regulator
MAKKALEKIAAGLREAIEVARGETTPARLYVPPEIDVKAIRKNTGLSQENFAYAYGFTVEQIRAWEQGRNRPLGGLRAYLMMIGSDPESVMKLLQSIRKKSKAA